MEKDLEKIGELGEEFGVTTGRKRKVNWLNLNKLIKAINLSGTNYLILSKLDVLEKLNIFKSIYGNNIIQTNDSINFKSKIIEILKKECPLLQPVVFSSDPSIHLFFYFFIKSFIRISIKHILFKNELCGYCLWSCLGR